MLGLDLTTVVRAGRKWAPYDVSLLLTDCASAVPDRRPLAISLFPFLFLSLKVFGPTV